MHIEIQNCFSLWGLRPPRSPTGASHLDPHWGTSVPRPPAQDAPNILYQVVTHPASSLAPDRESSRYDTSFLTTMPRRQEHND